MPQANFGVAEVYFIPPASAADITPIRIATMQDVQIDYDQAIEMLYGEKGVAVEAAVGIQKLSGKAKFAKIDGNLLAAALQGATLATGSKLKVEESAVLAAHSQTVTGSANFVDDLGVYDSTGEPYKKVAAGPTGLQYSVAAGVYTFEMATQDGKTLTYRYTKTQTSGKTTTLGNNPMGIATKYKVELFNTFPGNASKTLGAEISAAVIKKLSLPFKNTAFTIEDLDFEALDDGSGNFIKIYSQS
jgi:hypothetical protein